MGQTIENMLLHRGSPEFHAELDDQHNIILETQDDLVHTRRLVDGFFACIDDLARGGPGKNLKAYHNLLMDSPYLTEEEKEALGATYAIAMTQQLFVETSGKDEVVASQLRDGVDGRRKNLRVEYKVNYLGLTWEDAWKSEKI